jgi:uncharacterized YigZ family protein
MAEDLRRIARAGSNEIEIRKSRFICSVARVESDDGAREFIASLKKTHWQANHNCSAYIIGERGEIQRSSDDGEPSGTAGTPMLEVLRRMNLTDTAAVVTRYFGGTLLGTGGLIRAYGGVVSDTIRQVGIVQRRMLHVVSIDVDHVLAGKLHNALSSSGFPEASVTYGADGARFALHLEEHQLESFNAWIAETTNGSAIPVIQGRTSIDIPVDIDSDRE